MTGPLLRTSGHGCWPSEASRLVSCRVGFCQSGPFQGAGRSWDRLRGNDRAHGRNSLNIDGQSLATEYNPEGALRLTECVRSWAEVPRELIEAERSSMTGNPFVALVCRHWLARRFVMYRFLINFVNFIKLLSNFLFYQ